MNVERDRLRRRDVMDETRSPSYGKGKLQRALVVFNAGTLLISFLGFEHRATFRVIAATDGFETPPQPQ